MTDTLKIALAQLNPTVGNVSGNLEKLRAARADAASHGADLLVTSELFLAGYPPEDLVLKPAFQRACREAVEALAEETVNGGPALLVGTPWRDEGELYNSVVLLDAGRIVGVRHKVHLPNYGVFDEIRVFAPGPMPGPINFRGVRIGVPVCEDIWYPDVVECLEESGAELLLVPNGSPFDDRKYDARLNHSVARVKESGLPLAYVNQVGGQDELAFDGASFVLNPELDLAIQMPAWQEQVTLTTWRREDDEWSCADGERALVEEGFEGVYMALMEGLRDYVLKNRFPGVVLGLSGGIDSALVAAISVDALGADKVHCVMLPSEYTSEASLDDAAGCADLLGVKLDTVSIKEPVVAFDGALAHMFNDLPPDTTEENIQSRIRGVILMALSNKFGHMVVTTGNKSEVSVGYATLYGDMNGGYNPIKDLYKTEVYALADWRNQRKPKLALGPEGRVIPQNIIDKAPSAELKEDQTDQDSLPPYDVLDDILRGLVDKEEAVSEIVARGHDEATVRRIEHLLYIAEYKRRQAAPGVKIGVRNFGRDRRYPITNGFRDPKA